MFVHINKEVLLGLEFAIEILSRELMVSTLFGIRVYLIM